MTSKLFVETLKKWQSEKEFEKISRYFQVDHKENRVIGVRMKKIFDLSKQNTGMPLDEVNKLLDEPYYEARMGAVSILDFKARKKKLAEEEHRQLYQLYLNRHNRINSWDFIDRSAPHVIGRYLYDYNKPRDILYELALSGDIWERRTSIVGTAYFIRKRELEDTFSIAKILVNDTEELIHKAVGTWIRHAGKQDEKMLIRFLDRHASSMPRIMLSYAVEKLTREQKEYFRSL